MRAIHIKRAVGLGLVVLTGLQFVHMQQPGNSPSVGAGRAEATTIPDPTIHYTFDTDLLDAKSASTLIEAVPCPGPGGPCNSSSGFGSDADGRYWTWSSTDISGGGFTIETDTEIGATHTIALKFSFDTLGSWRKIIDYKNRQSDNGFYYYDDKLEFYPYTSQRSLTSYPANTVLDLLVVRKPIPSTSNSDFIVYAIGQDNSLNEIFRAVDTANNSLPHTFGTSPVRTLLGFFFDDSPTLSEATPTGKVYDLRIWANQALEPTVLAAAAQRPASPTGVSVTSPSASAVVSWTTVPNATSYLASAGGQSCTATAPATTCTITGLQNGQSVSVSVQAIGPGGYSAAFTSSAIVVGAATATTTTVASGSTTTSSPQLPVTGDSGTLFNWGILMLLAGVYAMLAVNTRRRGSIHR
jgi:hypothetical protein